MFAWLVASRYYDPVVGRFINADDAAYLGTSEIVLGYNLFAYCKNDSINNIDPIGCFSIPRLVISIPLDIICLFLSPYLAPVKAFAKRFAGIALKTRLSTPLIRLIKCVAQTASKIFNVIKNIVSRIPFWGNKWAKKINVTKLSESIAGATTSGIFNFVLNLIVPNITIFLSVGGFIAGLLDLLSDKKLDNKITFPFEW